MPQAAAKYQQQIAVGNELLLAALWIAAELLNAGGTFVLEHPSDSKRPGHVPKWHLPIIKRFQQSPAVKLVEFDQCTTGQTIVGPTTLMLIRLPQLRNAIIRLGRNGKCNHPRGTHEAAVGKNADGKWKTAAKKQYTPALCDLLAGGFIDAALNTPTTHLHSRHSRKHHA